MSVYRFLARSMGVAIAGLLATAAFARPELIASTPEDQAQLAAPKAVELRFSETLVPQSSAASLTMTEMPGMANHGAMKVAVSVSAGGDGKTMIITPKQPLPAGTYRVDWRAVSSDAQPVTGKLSFEVK